jgi:hypothetical protein
MSITNTTAKPDLIYGLPGMIEASERRGQAELVQSTLLPVQMDGKRATFERMGFKFGEVVKDDPLFIHVELPSGWKKQSTEHSMWSKIVDQNGAERVSIFYKAAFYDRDAFVRLCGRYDVQYPWDAPDAQTVETATAQVIDKKTGKVLHEATGTRSVDPRDGYVTKAGYAAQRVAQEWCKANLPEDQVEAWFAD